VRIDIHTHVFTLHSILSREAIRVVTQRLEDTGFVPDVLAEAIGGLLHEQLEKPEYLDERRLLRKLLQKLTGIDSFNEVVENQFSNDLISIQLNQDLDDLAADALSDIITRVLDAYAGGGVPGKILDVIEALRLSMQATITDIADDLLRHMDDDGIIVSLMLHIFGAPETAQDRQRYMSQINGAAEAALQRPGRILPFFGVHPERPGHLEELKNAIENKGFVGVKLYPSLGYSVDSDEMRLVYEYSIEKDLPVLLHCGHGGFYRTEDQIQLCDPAQWANVLADFDGLRVCFAHFGGWEALAKRYCLEENLPPEADPEDNWGKKIYDFMLTYPNVYTDLAKHVTMFENDADEEMYFDTMRELIADPAIGKRLLFGTDAWLLRLDMPVEEYWDLWRNAAGTAWDDITIDAPRAFLGFEGDSPADWRGKLTRYVGYMADNRESVGQEPAAWLSEAVAEPFTVDRNPPNWDTNSPAVRNTYQFLGEFLTEEQVAGDAIENRLIRLNELPYFDSDDPNFTGRCRDMARRFIDFSTQNRGYRGEHDFDSAVDLFIGIFKSGDMRSTT
jgi:predicted TIM-barrel fold metal-dependent hydrolase